MSALRSLLLGGLAAGLLTGCGPKAEHGYAEIALGYVQSPADTFTMNGAAIPVLKRKKLALIRERAGPAELKLVRDGASWTMCSLNIRKDRVSKITVVAVANVLRCETRV